MRAQFRLGYLYDRNFGLSEADYNGAVQWYMAAAEGGDTEAIFHLRYMYECVRDAWRNYQLAANWYRRALKGRDTTVIGRSQLRLCGMYEGGLIGESEEEELTRAEGTVRGGGRPHGGGVAWAWQTVC